MGSSEEGSEPGDVVRLEDKKVVITDAEPYNSLYSRPVSNGGLVTGSSTESSSENNSPNKCILTSGKLEKRKRPQRRTKLRKSKNQYRMPSDPRLGRNTCRK